MIQLEDVTKAYGADPILDSVTFTLGKKEKCALVGRNGAGKTTLFRLIIAQEEPDSGTLSISKNYRLGYLNQHIHFTQKTIIEEACLGLPEAEKESIYKAEAILFGLGFQNRLLELDPAVLSGGFALRLHLTKLLLSEPDCLLLDEPTNYLDILSIRWLTRFLKTWPHEMIVISHDRLFLDSVCTHTMAIHRQKIKKVEGPTAKLYSQIAAEEEIYEKTRVSLDKKKKHMQSFVDRFGAKNTKATQAQSRLKAIERLPELEALSMQDTLDFCFPSAQTASKIVLRAQNLSFGYNDSLLIQNLEFEIERDARVGIIGKNGKGKSTLLKLLTGDLEPKSGQMRPISELKVGYFGQSHIERLNPECTIEDEIQKSNPQASIQEVRSIAGKMQFPREKAEKKIGVLSGGEKSRVVLAKLLATRSHLLLLDEPTNHLDVESMESFMSAIEEFDGAVCIVCHSEYVLEKLCDTLIVFHDDHQELFLGTYNDFLAKGGWQDAEKRPEKKREVTERPKQPRVNLKRVSDLESRIIELETQVSKMNEELIEKVTKGHFLIDLSKQIEEKQLEIEQLFTALEKAHNPALT